MGSNITPGEFAEMMGRLNLFYDDFALDGEQTAAWYNYFLNYSKEELAEAIKLYVKEETWKPKVADLLKYVKKIAKIKYMAIHGTPEGIVEGMVKLQGRYSLTYEPDKYFTAVKDKYGDIASKIAKDYKSDLKEATTSSIQFIKQRMQKSYEVYLERELSGATNVFEALETYEATRIETKGYDLK